MATRDRKEWKEKKSQVILSLIMFISNSSNNGIFFSFHKSHKIANFSDFFACFPHCKNQPQVMAQIPFKNILAFFHNSP